jgi:hypothetical protein
MQQAVLVHARTDASFVEQVHRDLLDNPRAHPLKDVFAGLSLDDNVVDAVFVQELSEQQPRRAGANDSDLGAHIFFLADTASIGSLSSAAYRELIPINPFCYAPPK